MIRQLLIASMISMYARECCFCSFWHVEVEETRGVSLGVDAEGRENVCSGGMCGGGGAQRWTHAGHC